MTVRNAESQRLVKEITRAAGLHQLNTLNDAKQRVLYAVHQLGRDCTDADLAEVLGWTRQYVYRMVDELKDQGVLIQQPPAGSRGKAGRPPFRYQCICMTEREGDAT